MFVLNYFRHSAQDENTFTTKYWYIHCIAVTGFMLKGQRHFENELVAVEDIGEHDSALLCLTTNPACCSRQFTASNRGIGEWYYPNDTLVPIQATDTTAYRNRWKGTVRLNKRQERLPSGPRLQGIFTCEIPDNKGGTRNLTIGIFPRNKGKLQ